jgi:hypothetical protein
MKRRLLFDTKAGFPLGGILRAERNFSLSCDFSGGTIIRKDKEKFRSARNIPPSGKPALRRDFFYSLVYGSADCKYSESEK